MRTRSAAAAVGLVLTLSACSSFYGEVPDPEDIQCTWIHGDEAEMKLNPDGSLDYSGIPADVLNLVFQDPALAGGGELSGEGRWEIGTGLEPRDFAGFPVVTLVVGPADSPYLWPLRVRGAGDDLRLVAPTDDPDDVGDYTFTKSHCPAG